MATVTEWIEGARPRTLPTAIAPVVAGWGAAAWYGDIDWLPAGLAMVVSLALVIGVNFANDYSDGIRGTDDDRVGPMRLVGSGAASPSSVKAAAFTCLGVAAVAGVAVAALTAWWLLAVGTVCLAGSWFYTGGRKPYGYSGFGEVAVFVFFGLVAVLGTEFVSAGGVDGAGAFSAVVVGCFTTGVLVTNNLRDIPTDAETGKLTLAVRLGDAGTRRLFAVLMVLPLLLTVALAALTTWWVLVALVAAVPAAAALRPVVSGGRGPELIPALASTGMALLSWSIAASVALAFG